MVVQAPQSVAEYAWLWLPALLHAEEYLFLSFAAFLNAYQLIHACIQLSSDHIISSCASMQITFRGQAKQHIIQMSITQQSMDVNEDYHHCASFACWTRFYMFGRPWEHVLQVFYEIWWHAVIADRFNLLLRISIFVYRVEGLRTVSL